MTTSTLTLIPLLLCVLFVVSSLLADRFGKRFSDRGHYGIDY